MDIPKKYEIAVYVDGACWNNGFKNSKGGWSFVIQFDGNRKEIHAAGYVETTTNQRMELTAIIKALEEIQKRWTDTNQSVLLFSDSQYVVKGSNLWMFSWEKNGWKRGKSTGKNEKKEKKTSSSEISNLDLWKKVFVLVNEIKPEIRWIKGHSGNPYNELCDDLAGTAIKTKSDYYNLVRKPSTQELNRYDGRIR
jgi:ribonuclease HI